MSYKTNTIANRLRINKGWKNSLFPTKKWDYSFQTVLWFKVYLFLKAYLALKKIQLLSCEMRVSEKKTHILYLSINKIKSKKKKYARKTLMLKKFKSALNRKISKKAKYWLYSRNAFWLKQISFWKYNTIRQKILTRLWISKPRLFSWINLTNTIQTQRRSTRIYQKIRQQRNFFLSNSWRSFSFLNQRKFSGKKLKYIHRDVKGRKLLGLFIRLQKNILLLKDILLSSKFKNNISFTANKNDFSVFFFFLTKHLEKQMFLAKQSYSLYLNVYKQNFIFNSLNDVSIIKKQATEKQIKQKWQQTWNITQKQLKVFVIKTFIKNIGKKKSLNFIHLRSVFHRKTLPYHLRVPINNYFWKFVLEWYYLSLSKVDTLNMQLNLLHNYQRFFSQKTFQTLLVLVNKTKSEDQMFPYSDFNSFFRHNNLGNENLFIRAFLKKHIAKKNLKFHKRATNLILKKKLLPKKLFAFQAIRFEQKLRVKHISSYKKKNIFNYRLPYRQNYIQNLKFSVNYKMKYWLQFMIKQYFTIKFQIKLLWPLNQFKNIKFYRLAFPAKGKKKKTRKKEEKDNVSILKKYKKKFSKKTYIYVAKTTNHLTTKRSKKKIDPSKKNFFFLRSLEKNLGKKRPYFLEKWTRTQNSKKLRISRFSNLPFMKNLIPTLILFVKYLDAQLLANEVAKIIEKAKRQGWFLYDLRQIFRSLFIKNIAGYKIVIIGRVNGRKKTRLLAIKNSKESNSQQTWTKQVNFGAAQARGRIGTFGIKIWIYN